MTQSDSKVSQWQWIYLHSLEMVLPPVTLLWDMLTLIICTNPF